jgi:hypothetical protein
MVQKNHIRLAELAHLIPMDKGGPFGPSAAGSIDGFPVGIAWTNVNKVAVVAILIRFRKGSLTTPADAFKKEIAASPDILAAIGRKKLGGAEAKLLSVTPDSLAFYWQFSLRSPKPEAVHDLLRVLLRTVAERAKPVGAKCEACDTMTGDLFCVNGIPSVLCAACRERAGEEDRRKAEAYAAQPSNPGLGTLAGLLSCAVMALAWGLLAYSLNRIFLYGGILIGLAIAWAVNKGMGKVNTYGRVLTVGLTLAAVMLGDFFFITLLAKDQLKASLDLALVSTVADQFLGIEFGSGDGYLTLLFGLIGAAYILFKNRPPLGERKMVPVRATEG